MKPLLRIILTILLVQTSVVSVIASPKSNVAYSVQINDHTPAIAHVTAQFIPETNRLYMFPGANNHNKRWARFISDVSMKKLDGTLVPVRQIEDGSWIIPQDITSPVTLEYKVNLKHEEFEWTGGVDGAAYLREDGVFYTGRSMFIVNGQERSDIKMTFNLPTSWNISTPWKPTGNKNQFVVNNYHDLATSMFFAGTHHETRIKDGHFELILAMGAGVNKYQAEFVDLAKGILRYYTTLMGGLPRTTEQKELKTLVIINSDSSSDGEAIGNNISILLNPDGDEMEQIIARFIFAHEFFHLWNGKSFAPDSGELEWFKEGVSNYYTIKSLNHVGFLTDQTFIGIFENFFYQRYISDTGLGQFPITDGDRKHSNWGLIYSGGMMSGIALDMMIRDYSANKHSLDNVMRDLYLKYSGYNHYSTMLLKSILNTYYPRGVDRFFADYVHGTKTIPIADYLIHAGILSKPSDNMPGLYLKENPDRDEQSVRQGLMGKLAPN